MKHSTRLQPNIDPDASVASLIRTREVYFSLLDRIRELRAEMFANREPLADRLAAASCDEDVRYWISVVDARLSQHARRGQVAQGEPDYLVIGVTP